MKNVFEEHGIPSISLRLPDVFGPFDVTDRHWSLQLWMRLQPHFPLLVSQKDQQRKLSFVFSADVVKAIEAIIDDKNLHHGYSCFNLSLDETPTLLEYLQEMAKCLQVPATIRPKLKGNWA